jgi:hypothetical protein
MIIVALLLLAVIITLILFYQFVGKKTGSMPIFISSYKLLKNKLPEMPEELILKESFKPFTQRKPFNILKEDDIDFLIKALEPFGVERYQMMALLIFISDKKRDASFLLNSDSILSEIKKYYENRKWLTLDTNCIY